MRLFSISMQIILAMALIVSAISAQQEDLIIRNDGVGKLKLGMTVRDAKNALPGHVFERTSDGEGVALISVSRGKEVRFMVYAGEDDPDKPINQLAIIKDIGVLDPKTRTPEGLSPGMKLKDAEKVAGKVTEIILSEIEAREFVYFEKSRGMYIRVMSETGFAGIYAEGSRVTKKYRDDATIYIIYIHPDYESAEKTSVYTDLAKDCKQMPMSEESQHSSTKCKGFGGYTLHIFDSATTLEFVIEKDDDQSIRLASQALSYDLKKAKLEWRMNGDDPFAVIFRVNDYAKGSDGLIAYPAKVTGEYLVVKGIPPYGDADEKIDVRNDPNANESAREAADMSFVAGGNKDGEGKAIDVSELNAAISAAAAKNESWIKSAMEVTAKVAGDFSETAFRSVEIESPGGAEGGTVLDVTVTDDGLMDDSVRGEKRVYKLEVGSNGVWKVVSGSKTWRCWEGRGHTGWGTKPCL